MQEMSQITHGPKIKGFALVSQITSLKICPRMCPFDSEIRGNETMCMLITLYPKIVHNGIEVSFFFAYIYYTGSNPRPLFSHTPNC